jgi:phosphatidylethanolamine/phosphatidyl-N-methylethanolamine N-methyltransferase
MEERHLFKIKNMSKAFIKEFWKDKKMIGSILPSSKFLAAKMLNHIPLENTKLIIEL